MPLGVPSGSTKKVEYFGFLRKEIVIVNIELTLYLNPLILKSSVSDSVNQGTSTARGTRKPVRLVVYKRGSKARERKGEEEQRRSK